MTGWWKFNIPKCKIMQITTHHSKSHFIYKMCNISLDTVTEHEYLGICLHRVISYPGVLMLTVFEIKQTACWVSWNEIYTVHKHRSKNVFITHIWEDFSRKLYHENLLSRQNGMNHENFSPARKFVISIMTHYNIISF